MVTLSQFPVEILSIITSSLNGFDIGHLWTSGDRMLMEHLENGGVTRFEIALAQTINCKWPTLISRFSRLESLSIRPKSTEHRIWFRDVDYAGISSTLKHLDLEFDNLEFSLFGLPFVVPDDHPDPIWSPPTEGKMIMSPFPVSTHFPCIETITFGGKMKFPSILIPMLPLGLVSLSLPYESMEASIVLRLPPKLARLQLPKCSHINIDENSFTFPSSVTHLDIPNLNIFDIMQATDLPPSLTHLNTSLHSDSLDAFSNVQLPATLTSLGDFSWEPLDTVHFEDLPSTLLRLCVKSHQIPVKLKSLPSGLQTLITTRIAGLEDTSLFELPSLTHLALNETALSSETLFSLPKCLRHLHMHAPFLNTGTPYPFMTNLEYLDVTMLDASALAYAPRLATLNIEDFSSQSPRLLGHLTSLSSLSIVYDLELTDETLPPSLTDLVIPSLKSPLSVQYLPRGLRKLRNLVTIDVSIESITHLPPGLTELKLLSKESFSDASISLLPRSLEVLTLQKTKKVTDDGISKLPRNLRYLEFGKVPLLTNACASLFPRQLTTLDLGDAPSLSDACVNDLPRSITSFSILGDAQFEVCIRDAASPDLLLP